MQKKNTKRADINSQGKIRITKPKKNHPVKCLIINVLSNRKYTKIGFNSF